MDSWRARSPCMKERKLDEDPGHLASNLISPQGILSMSLNPSEAKTGRKQEPIIFIPVSPKILPPPSHRGGNGLGGHMTCCCHTASNWQSWNANLNSLTPEPKIQGTRWQFYGSQRSYRTAGILGTVEPAWLISLRVECLLISLQQQNGPQLENY